MRACLLARARARCISSFRPCLHPDNFCSKSNHLFSSWSNKRSTVTHSIIISGNLNARGFSNDRSDATVMACAGAVVWRFDVPQTRSNYPDSPHAQPLVINEELLMLRSLARELVESLKDHRTLLVASEKENAVLQCALQVTSREHSCQTDVTGPILKMEQDAVVQERTFLQQTVSDLRRQLMQFETDPHRSFAQQRISQLQNELSATQDKASQEAAKYEARIGQLLAQDQQRQEAYREALDARSDCELRNAIVEELVKQLEIAVARLEGEKRAAAERYASLRAVMSAVEDRAVQAEKQHAQLLQKICLELSHHD